ncbi:hypothetical protein F4679DRAFT_594549 [Xylaria curta]|nr:hypothetical protein F4679DRAFT_594549 [Xylaria curta]
MPTDSIKLTQPFVLRLPVELCELIIYQLSCQDMKSLMLTCTAFAAIARPILSNSQVVLSRLIEDRNRFEKHLKNHPKHIQEVIWQGLDLESLMKNTAVWESILRQACTSSVVPSVVRDPNLLWMPVELVDSSYANMCRESADWISEQVKSLPNMTTLTIKPMPDTRAFGLEVEPHHIKNPKGQFDFLIALSTLSQPWSKVRTLNLYTGPQGTNIWRAPIQDSQAFQYLTTINICVMPSPEEYEGRDRTRTLVRCLRRATNLRSLKLCFLDVQYNKRKSLESSEPRMFVNELFEYPWSGEINWRHLHSLHIVNLPGVGPYFGINFSSIKTLLRHITLDDCDTTPYDLACFGKWQLYSITIRSRYSCPRVSEERVLDFVRGLRGQVESLGPGITKTTKIVTDPPLCNPCLSCTK